MAKKNQNDKNQAEDSRPEAEDYPVRPGSQASDKPIDEQRIDEWGSEDLEAFLDEEGELEPAPDEVEARAEAETALHADAYSALTPDELDEFDSLLDEDGDPLPFQVIDLEKQQLTLLDLEPGEIEEMEQLFGDEPELTPAGQLDAAPIAMFDDEMEDPATMSTPATPVFRDSGEEPTPNFEDKGMGAGFYVADEELQPTLPEEMEYAPLPDQVEYYQQQAEAAAAAAAAEAEREEDSTFEPEIYFPPGPTEEHQKAPFVFEDLPPNAQIVEEQVTFDRVDSLMNRAENARRRINEEIDSIELARELLELIRSASTLILSGKDKYEEAERSLNEVEYRLSYSRRVKVWSDAISYRLLAYEVFWLMTLGIGALFIPSGLSSMILRLAELGPTGLPAFIQLDDLFLGISTALWGGLGGVVGAMYSLWRHVSLKQDFNPQHKMWYYTQPIMGIPIGIVTFLLVRIGIGFTVEGVSFASPYAIYMIAWIAGFQQNILYEIIRQMLRIFRLQN